MNKKTIIVLSVLNILITFMDISGLPGVLFPITVADVSPYILPLLLNFLFIGMVAYFTIKLFHIEYRFGYQKEGLRAGLKKYAVPGIFAGVLSLIAFCIGLFPFDYKPTVWKILLEGIVYYIGVGIIEEFYVRALFLNIVEELLHKNKKKTELAIIISSTAFGLGHIPGMIGMGMGVIIFKVISTIGMGLYFGTIYKKTRNIWVPVIMHCLIDICALPYCFTENMRYETSSLIILVVTYVLLGIYCFREMQNTKKRSYLKNTIGV